MQVVGSVLSNLKNMAQDMGSEIEKQNKQLDKITNKVTLAFFNFVTLTLLLGCTLNP